MLVGVTQLVFSTSHAEPDDALKEAARARVPAVPFPSVSRHAPFLL